MQYTEPGYNLTKSFESLRLKAYQDQGGVWSCGYGHTRGVKSTTTCSVEQANVWLEEDVQGSVSAINSLVKVPLEQFQFNALVDFVFNIGCGSKEKGTGFAGSTCLRMLNNEKYDAAADSMLLFNKVKGVVAPGLTRRREAERAMFLGLV
jgi:lysozyme